MTHPPLNPADYRDKVYGCWQGKGIGGTLGMPYEGVPHPLELRFYEHTPTQPVPNDDLELQLVWLWYGEKYGAALRARHLAKAWAEHIGGGPDEYGVACWNIRRGFAPPVTGKHNNMFTDGMGAAIRAEIWACLFPGRPELAAHYAREDACVDHAGDGVWAEAFLAAAESTAFLQPDIRDVLNAGLSHIPDNCRVAQAVRAVMRLHADGVPLTDLRPRIMRAFGSHNFTNCVMNLSFLIAGLLYGEGDFGRTILTAVNFGMDTDCTGATAGAFMGILLGAAKIPEEWKAPLGDSVVVSDFLRPLPLPATLDEVTDRTLALAERFARETRDGPPYASTYAEPPAEDTSDGHRWLLFRYPPDAETSSVPPEVTEAESHPDRHRGLALDAPGIHLDLSPHVAPPGSALFLVTRLTVPENVDGFLMVCADTGLTVWLDGKRIMEYHGRLRALPAFHRTEGGGAVPVTLEAHREYTLRVRLLACHKPLGLTAAVGDATFKYVDASFHI